MQKFTRPLSPSARKFVPHSSPLPTRSMGAANDAAQLMPSIVGNTGAVAFRIGADGEFFMPFGTWKTARGVINFDRASGAALAAGNSAVESRGGMLTKLAAPIYAGHPDIAGRTETSPSAGALGWVERIDVEAAGIRLRIEWPPTDNPVAKRQYAFFEPWLVLQKVSGGFQPTKILSIGLVNSPGTVALGVENDRAELARSTALRSIDRQDAIAAVSARFPHLSYPERFDLAARQNPALFR